MVDVCEGCVVWSLLSVVHAPCAVCDTIPSFSFCAYCPFSGEAVAPSELADQARWTAIRREIELETENERERERARTSGKYLRVKLTHTKQLFHCFY